MSDQRRGLDLGRVGALTDIGFAIVFGLLLFLATQWRGDAVPRPLVVTALFSTAGVVGLIGVLTRQPWLLIAGALPLFPGIFISFTGIGLIFLIPALLMLAGAVQMLRTPGSRRLTVITLAGAFAIGVLIVVAAWVVLIAMPTGACYMTDEGRVCGDGNISTSGVLVAGGCLAAALAIAVIGSRTGRRKV